MSDFLTADAILAFDDVQVRDEHVPEWGGTVRLRSLSGKDRDAYDASVVSQRGKQTVTNLANIRAKLVGRSAIDPDTGSRLFSEEQIGALGEKNAAVLDRLYDIAAELSGLASSTQEELAGNSDAAASGDSGSSSPEN